MLRRVAAWFCCLPFTPLLVAAVLCVFPGCETAQRQAAVDAAAYPPDFTLEFFVASRIDSVTAEPHQRSAQHTVTPDRRLRAALGPGVSDRFHPPATATVAPADMATLVRLADAAFAAEADAPPRTAAVRPLVAYRLVRTAHGQRDVLTTTPDRNPAARALLDDLIRLRGGR